MKKRDERMAQESLKRTMKEMFIANDRNRQGIERSIGGETGYPVVSTFPTGVSDGFIVFHTMSRRLHMYDGTTWISLGDVGAYVSLIQSMIGLIGFWPISSFDMAASLFDISGQGRTLTYGAGTIAILNNRLTYVSLNGSTAYWHRADEAGLDLTAAITLGFWYKPGATGTQVIFSKFGAVGQYSYEIAYISGTGFRFQMSGDGTNIRSVTSADTSIDTNTWYHVVGRFASSTEVAIFVNGVKVINTTSVPASLFNSTTSLNLGRRPDATFYTTGSVCFPFISRSYMADSYITALYEEGIPLFT